MNEKPEFKARITPEQVKEALKRKNNPGKDNSTQKDQQGSKTHEAKENVAKEKSKRGGKQKPIKFPLDARINDYGFLNFRKPLLAALGWRKGMSVKISKNEDGSLTVRES